MNYENIEKIYAPYNKLKIDLDKVEISENKCNKLSKIPKLQNPKCNSINNNKESNYIFDKVVKKQVIAKIYYLIIKLIILIMNGKIVTK